MAGTLTGPQLAKVMKEVGVQAVKNADLAVDRDIGGNTFSGWARAPIVFEATQVREGVVEVGATPRSEGPLTVAQSGRRAGSRFSRKRGRNVGWGATTGKRTWDDVVVLVQDSMPQQTIDLIGDNMQRGWDG